MLWWAELSKTGTQSHSLKKQKKKQQKNMSQMKEQDKTPEKQLNEVEIGNLPEKEFRIMIVKMIQDQIGRASCRERV